MGSMSVVGQGFDVDVGGVDRASLSEGFGRFGGRGSFGLDGWSVVGGRARLRIPLTRPPAQILTVTVRKNEKYQLESK